MSRNKKRKIRIIPNKAIIYASMVGSLLNQYEDDEITYTVACMKRNIGLMLRSAEMTNPSIYVKAIMTGDRIWKESLDYWAAQNKKIEIIHTVAVLYDESSTEFNRLCKVTDKMMDRFVVEGAGTHNTSVDVQADSSDVALFLVNKVREYLGKEPRVNKLAGLKEKMENKDHEK